EILVYSLFYIGSEDAERNIAAAVEAGDGNFMAALIQHHCKFTGQGKFKTGITVDDVTPVGPRESLGYKPGSFFCYDYLKHPARCYEVCSLYHCEQRG